MKRFLLSFGILVLFFYQTQAQCTIEQSSIKISDISSVPSASGCDITFTLEFDIGANGGNKWSFVHLWNANAAPSPAINWNSKPKPTLALLQKGANSAIAPLLRTLALDYSGTNINVVIPRGFFPASSDVNSTVQSVGIVVTKADGHFKIEGIKLSLPSCGSLVNLKADVWSAQDQNGKLVSCGTAGLAFVANDPALRGMMNCSPTGFSLSIHTTENRKITFTAYSDANDNGQIDATDTIPANILISPTNVPYSNIVINNTGSPDPLYYNTYGPYYYQSAPGTKKSVIIVAQGEGVINRSLLVIENGCTVTPVKFKSFNADRKNSSTVTLKWITASEQNNRGFYIQRNIGGEWKNMAFVFSQADGGNSASDLSYEYFDANLEKGISQYRIQQVDIDSKATYSDIRAVRGEGTANKVSVYPNPSFDGKVNLVFENSNSIRDVQVSDMQGRVVKIYKEVRGNVLIVEKLSSGFYTLKVTDRSTAVSSVEKVVVK